MVAADASLAQVRRAAAAPGLWRVAARAEQAALRARSVDLVAVAQALHWFDPEPFWAEVRRVLAPGGAVAAWTYALPAAGPRVDAVVRRFYRDVVGPWWPPERRHVETGYRDLPFPVREVEAPPLAIVVRWTLEDLLGYLSTWSAARAFSAATGADPRRVIADELGAAWGPPARRRTLSFRLAVRAGRLGG